MQFLFQVLKMFLNNLECVFFLNGRICISPNGTKYSRMDQVCVGCEVGFN